MKKLLAMLLAATALLTSLTACADTDEGGNAETTAASTFSDATTEEETAAPLKDNLPEELDFDGDTITIISREREGWTSGEIWVESQNGDIVNDAVYERNMAVEGRLGVKIENVQKTRIDAGEVIEEVKLAVQSKSGDYDIVAAASSSAAGASLSGIFADLRTSKYLDFDQPWWSQGYNEVMEYKGKQFVATGPICLSTYRFAFVTLFNKQLFENAVIEFPYDKVRKYEWTLDYQASLIPLLYKDDGDGVQEIDDDIYGYTTGDYISLFPYCSTCDIPMFAKNAESGEFEYVIDVDRVDKATDKLLNLYYGNGDAVFVHEFQLHDLDQDEIRKMFANCHAGMATMRLMEVERADMRDMKDDYGILPMPAYDENQKNYQTMLHDQFTVVCVPSTVVGDELDKMSAVLEAMAVEGARHITPAYYETALRYKHLSDPDSWEMLTIISDGIYMDAACIYGGGPMGIFKQMVNAKSNTVSSTLKGQRRSVATFLSKLNKQLSEVGEEG